MSAAPLMLLAIVSLAAGYLLYGRFLARRFGLKAEAPTPAHTLEDGVDYVPSKPQILMGHHFSSIAGAAPIIGPVFAVVFGWLPVYLWVLLGGIFIGAAHDLASLVVSIRHGGRSIGEVIEQQVGRSAKSLFLVFAWATLMLVVAVFTNTVAATFAKSPEAATSSLLLTVFAVFFGLGIYRWGIALGPATLASLGLIALSLLAGCWLPARLDPTLWKLVLLGYVFIASVAPVWLLLQPRDFMNSFLLYALLLVGVAGILWSNPAVEAPALGAFSGPRGPLFPRLFVPGACGAVSGFHSLVASGTTAKQLDRETHALPVAAGSMLIESLLAVVALFSAAMLAPALCGAMVGDQAAGGPIHVFASGMGSFFAAFGLSDRAGVVFASVAVAAFALTSLDTATRIGRMALQELAAPAPGAAGPAARIRGRLAASRHLATTITVALSGALALSGGGGAIWPSFGAANELLAALTFLAVLAWLARRGQKRRFILLPAAFMFATTLAALLYQAYNFAAERKWFLAGLAGLLALLALVLLAEAWKTLWGRQGAPESS